MLFRFLFEMSLGDLVEITVGSRPSSNRGLRWTDSPFGLLDYIADEFPSLSKLGCVLLLSDHQRELPVMTAIQLVRIIPKAV